MTRCLPPAALWRVVLLLLTCLLARGSDWTWTYSVRATATVNASPPRVTLQWPTDEIPATGYNIRRKDPDELAWGNTVSLPANATSYTDENVSVGRAYEYQIEKQSALYSAWGYLCVGVNAPLIEARGKVILVVDNSVAGAIGGELQRLQQDLVGDGWGVVRKDVARDDRPENVRNLIRDEWQADRANVRAVFLLGHVPVVRSGNLNVDGHGSRPMPADVYYADMDGTWTDANGDGVLDQSGLTSDVELEIGRVDFADLPGTYSGNPFPSEIDLLRRYLDKDHAFRHAITRPAARALMGNVVGDGRGQAYAASGYRTFAALVGPENVTEAGTDLLAPASERWISKVTARDYLWTYACGAGSDISLGILGTHGEFNDVWGADFVQMGAKATFYMLFGSWMAEWSKQDNLMRSALAAPDYGLTAVWSGRPHWYFHHMGIGREIGASARLTQNNNGLMYRNQVQRQTRGVHIALMGDPTLRLTAVAPPRDLQATVSGGDVTLSWTPSSDAVFGYRVYRSASPGAPFERISGELHPDTRFTDHPANPADATYMVRAVTLQLGPSGSYYNASEGVFSRGDVAIPASAPSGLPPVVSGGKITGAATEVGTDIRHPNGNVFDQVLLQGGAASMSADPGQVLRVSFLDRNDDIVQVEFSGAGTLAIMLDDVSGPAAPSNYNQGIAYMKGHASIAITGANETTNVAIFGVGRATAVDQSLFRADTSYDGMADIAFILISSVNGRFGSVRTGNVRYSARQGMTGIFASDVQFTGPVLIGNINAADGATPVIGLGAASGPEARNDVRITGGDLAQDNGRAVQISGLTQLLFVDGTDANGHFQPAQLNRAKLERNGVDVTLQVVVNPGP
jgi:hypothetical protein